MTIVPHDGIVPSNANLQLHGVNCCRHAITKTELLRMSAWNDVPEVWRHKWSITYYVLASE